MSFSRRFLKMTTAGLCALASLTGCGLKTGEAAPKKIPPSYSGKGFSCVGKMPEHFDKYVNDELSVEEINAFAGCLEKAFTTFAQLTRGRSEDTYSPDEIRNFLHDFFLGPRRISDELMHEFMVLKKAMVGGRIDAISRPELYLAVEIIEDLKNEAIRLKPHLRVLNPKLAVKQDPAKLGQMLLEANEAMNSTIAVVAKRLQANNSSYPLENLQNILTDFRAFVNWDEHFPDAIPPAQLVNFLRVFRQATVAPTDSAVVNSSDWAPMLQSFTRWYLVFLQYEVGVKDQPLLRGVGLQNSMGLAQEIFNLLDQCISRQHGLTLTFNQLDEIVGALHDLKWIPARIRVTSIGKALRALVTRSLGDPDITASLRKSEGLNLAGVSRARDLFYRWAYVQVNLDSRMGPQANLLSEQQTVPSIQVLPYLNPDIRSKIVGLRTSEWDDFMKVRTLMRPLFPEGSERILLVGADDMSAKGLVHGFHNLSMMNLWRAAVSVIYRGYAEKAGSSIGWDSGITSDEMQKFFEDYREIGIDLRLLDERNANTGSRAFIESNLFTYDADGLIPGDDSPRGRTSFVESMEHFSFLYSGGRMAIDFYNTLGNVCDAGPLDIKGRPTLARQCVIDNLPQLFDTYLTNMPGLHAYLRGLSDQDRRDYAHTLIETAFNSKFSQDDWVELNELSTLAVVLHYSEAVMTRYDTNKDGILTNDEIDLAADIFMGFIKKFAQDSMKKSLYDWQARAAFFYILTNREMPKGAIDILWTYADPADLKLNRQDLANVFKVIIRNLFEIKAPEPVVPATDANWTCRAFQSPIPANCWSPAFFP